MCILAAEDLYMYGWSDEMMLINYNNRNSYR